MKIEADKIRKLSCWHTGVQSGSSQGDMECLSVLRRKPTHRCTVRVRSGWYGVPVCTEKEAYTQVYSQGDMECLSVLRRKPTHRCTVRVWSGWYGVSVLRRKPTHRCTVRVIWSVCTEKEAYTQVYSQVMECLSVLRRKPTHRCTVRVIWSLRRKPTHRCTVRVMESLSVLRRKPTHRCTVRWWSACLYWEGSLHTGVQSGWYGVWEGSLHIHTGVQSGWYGVSVCTEKEAYTQVYSQGPVRVIWSVCLYWEGSLHTGVQSGSSQGDMECLSVLRRKPDGRSQSWPRHRVHWFLSQGSDNECVAHHTHDMLNLLVTCT